MKWAVAWRACHLWDQIAQEWMLTGANLGGGHWVCMHPPFRKSVMVETGWTICTYIYIPTARKLIIQNVLQIISVGTIGAMGAHNVCSASSIFLSTAFASGRYGSVPIKESIFLYLSQSWCVWWQSSDNATAAIELNIPLKFLLAAAEFSPMSNSAWRSRAHNPSQVLCVSTPLAAYKFWRHTTLHSSVCKRWLNWVVLQLRHCLQCGSLCRRLCRTKAMVASTMKRACSALI